MKNISRGTNRSLRDMAIVVLAAGMVLCLASSACTRAEEAAPVVEMMDQADDAAEAPALLEELPAADDAGDADETVTGSDVPEGGAPALQEPPAEEAVSQTPAAGAPATSGD